MKRIFQIIPDVYDNKLILYLSSEKRIKMVFPRFIKTYIIPIFNTNLKYLDIFKRLCLQKKDRALFHLCHIFIALIFFKHEKETGALLYKNSFDRTITSFLATSNIGDLVVA